MKKQRKSTRRVHCSLNGKLTLCGEKATGMFYTRTGPFLKAAEIYACCHECQEIARKKQEAS